MRSVASVKKRIDTQSSKNHFILFLSSVTVFAGVVFEDVEKDAICIVSQKGKRNVNKNKALQQRREAQVRQFD